MSLSVEFKRWNRTRRLLVVAFLFLFSGITSPLIAEYSADIFGALGASETVTITVSAPTWQNLVDSYFKNSSQLALLLAGYLVGWACALGPDERLRLFYRSRATGPWQIFGPRLAVSAIVASIGALAGAAMAGYETVVLHPELEWGLLVGGLALQAGALVVFILLAGVLACWTNAPFLSAIVIAAVVFLGGLFTGAEGFRKWSPTALLSPSGLIAGDGTNQWGAGLVSLVVLSAAIASVLVIRIRSNGHRST